MKTQKTQKTSDIFNNSGLRYIKPSYLPYKSLYALYG